MQQIPFTRRAAGKAAEFRHLKGSLVGRGHEKVIVAEEANAGQVFAFVQQANQPAEERLPHLAVSPNDRATQTPIPPKTHQWRIAKKGLAVREHVCGPHRRPVLHSQHN